MRQDEISEMWKPLPHPKKRPPAKLTAQSAVSRCVVTNGYRNRKPLASSMRPRGTPMVNVTESAEVSAILEIFASWFDVESLGEDRLEILKQQLFQVLPPRR